MLAIGLTTLQALAKDPKHDIDYVNIPRVTYCSPEIASVGMTEASATRTPRCSSS